uniref:hypothetical protein n=1 Tax=Dialister sp. TaxID=1955814 RepID=UPI0040262E80
FLDFARNDNGANRYQNFAALLIFMRRTLIPNFSFEQSFHSQSRDSMSSGPTLNLEPHIVLYK